jgi:hypothetical protein
LFFCFLFCLFLLKFLFEEDVIWINCNCSLIIYFNIVFYFNICIHFCIHRL